MPADTAILVIDMQKDFVDTEAPLYCPGVRDIVPAIQKLLKGGRDRGWPIIHIIRGHDRHGVDLEKFRLELFNKTGGYAVTGTAGWEIIPELEPAPGDIVIEKVRFSGFFATKLDLVLRRLGVRRLVICGTQYPNCIRATAVDGLSYDYDVIVCTDAAWGASREVVAANIRDLDNMGAQCLPLGKILN